jgi:quinol monooxygenase YgiN
MSATLAARHTVADYSAWRVVYDEVEPIRAKHGCTEQTVLRLPTDANDLFITHVFPTVDQAAAFAEDPDFGAAMQRAGVTGPPRIEIFESV